MEEAIKIVFDESYNRYLFYIDGKKKVDFMFDDYEKALFWKQTLETVSFLK